MSSASRRLLHQTLATQNTLLRRTSQSAKAATSTAVTSSKGIANVSFHHLSTNKILPPLATSRFFSTEIVPGVGKGKTSTGLVGIAVDPDAIPKLISKNRALLSKMAASDMPPTAQYYINVAQISNYRIQMALDNPDDPEKIEELCQCGQIEELVIQADNEMIVLDMYLKNRWWEMIKDTEIEYGDPTDDGGSDEEGVDWDEGLDRKDGGAKN